MNFPALFKDMFDKGELGKNIVDVGCGRHPVTRFLPEELDAKMVEIDIAGEEGAYDEHHLKLKADLRDLDNFSMIRDKVRMVSPFLGIEKCETLRQIDSFVFSDILNYVPYRKLLRFLKKYLKPGGRYVVQEAPGRGYANYHSSYGLDSMASLHRVLEKEGFVIERGPQVNPFERIIVARLDA